MQRERLVVVALPLAVAVLLPLGGCAGDGDRTFTPAELGEQLLTVDDLRAIDPAADWTETQRMLFEERAPENPSIDPSLWCPEFDDKSPQLTTLAGPSGADVELERSSGDGQDQAVYGMRQQAWSNKDAADYLREFAVAVSTCDGVTWSDTSGDASGGTETAEYRLTPLDAPAVGDEAAAALVTITVTPPSGGEPLMILQRMAAVRSGRIVMLLQEGTTVSPDADPATSDADFAALVEQAARPFVDLDHGTD